MPQPPDLTDRTALTRNRARALRQKPALFLHEDVAADLQERLIEVNRRFTNPAIVTGFPEFWATVLPGAQIVADSDLLDLTTGGHDLVIHALALHWSNDPVGQLVQCRRALAPDGLFIAAFFGGQTLAELRACLAEAEVALTGGLSPRVLPMAEIRDAGGLLQRAGFALPVADSATRTATYAGLRTLMADLRAMGEASALAARPRHLTRRTLFSAAEVLYRTNYPATGNRIRAGFEVIFLTGWAPAETQAKPLRPGSASQRLADALGVPEQPLPRSD